MSNQLVVPVFYVYKLTFKSGKTYIGSHKQKKERDSYITSSSYYLRHHNEDPLIKREILIKVENQYQMDFLETWCILSDKAYNKDNVNYNLGNFFHRFSTAYHTKEEKQAAIEKRRLTWSKKTPEELKSIVEKQKHTMSLKSPEELADIHYRQGRNKNGNGNTHKSEWWASLSESEKDETKRRMSESGKRRCAKMTEEQKEHFRKALSQSKQGTHISDEHKKLISIIVKKQYETDKELSERRINGLRKSSELRKKKIMCVETNEVFDSLLDAAKWIGPKAKGCNISAQARGITSFAYHHPITGEPLHWEFVNIN